MEDALRAGERQIQEELQTGGQKEVDRERHRKTRETGRVR